jgi:hypothetical protein
MTSKWPTVVEIAAGSPEFDGSVPGYRQLQQAVASATDHRCFFLNMNIAIYRHEYRNKVVSWSAG